MNNGFPVVRVELEGMRMTLQTALTEHIAGRDRDIREALNEAVTAFDIKAEVRQQATKQFRSMVADVVGSAIRKALWDNRDFQQKVTAMVADAIAEQIKKGDA